GPAELLNEQSHGGPGYRRVDAASVGLDGPKAPDPPAATRPRRAPVRGPTDPDRAPDQPGPGLAAPRRRGAQPLRRRPVGDPRRLTGRATVAPPWARTSGHDRRQGDRRASPRRPRPGGERRRGAGWC